MARAVFVTSYPFPGIGATASRVSALVEGILRRPGWTATVVGPGPDAASKGIDLSAQSFELRSFPERPYARRNLAKRAFREILQAKRLLAGARKSSPDVLIVTVPSVFLLAATLLESRKPVIVDLRDLVWEYFASRDGVAKFSGKILRWFAARALKRASAITVTNMHEAEALAKHCSVKSELVRNGITFSRFSALSKISENCVKESDGLHVLYTGNIGLAQRLDTLVYAVSGLCHVHASLIGTGADVGRLTDLIHRLGSSNVKIGSPREWTQLLPLYRDADVLYAQIGRAYNTAIPSKLFEYLSTGKPVIFGAPEGSAASLMRKFSGVYIVPAENVDKLREAIESIKISGNPDVWRQNIRRIGEKHLREVQADHFASIVDRAYESNRCSTPVEGVM